MDPNISEEDRPDFNEEEWHAHEALQRVRGAIAATGTWEKAHPSNNRQERGGDAIETGYSHGEVWVRLYEDRDRKHTIEFKVVSAKGEKEANKQIQWWMQRRSGKRTTEALREAGERIRATFPQPPFLRPEDQG